MKPFTPNTPNRVVPQPTFYPYFDGIYKHTLYPWMHQQFLDTPWTNPKYLNKPSTQINPKPTLNNPK